MADTRDFNRKLDLLQNRFKFPTREALLRRLNRYEVRYSVSSLWETQENPSLRNVYRERFAHYWYAAHGLPFIHDCYMMPFDEFERYLDRMPPIAGPPKPSREIPPDILGQVQAYADTYQIIRPLTDRSGYALEPFEIVETNGAVQNFMYSQTTPVTRDFLYAGDVELGDRYYFSLLRRHENKNKSKAAYRCIATYLGRQLPTERSCLSGLMLRGVTGDQTVTQVTGIPFIALRVPGHRTLREPVATDLQPRVLRRLTPEGHILVGQINSFDHGRLYECCDRIFSRLRAKETTLISESGVLHTVPAKDLELVTDISLEVWKEGVDHYLRNRRSQGSGGSP